MPVSEQGVIIDNGSGIIKAGFSGDFKPKVVFPTVVGRSKDAAAKDFFVGDAAQTKRGILAIENPIEKGIITKWDDMELLWDHTFNELKVGKGERPVLTTEPALNPLETREKSIQIMFEKFEVPSYYVAIQSVLALYAAGRKDGISVESGEGITHTVPISGGYAVHEAIMRMVESGSTVTDYLAELIKARGTAIDHVTARDIKEKYACVSLDYDKDLAGSPSEVSYTLPDGSTISLGQERFKCAEVMFNPSLVGSTAKGIHVNANESILKCDESIRPDMYKNIVISGGNTMLNGMVERMTKEMKNFVPGLAPEEFNVIASPERSYSAWIGGSILAKLDEFKCMWITKQEYEENGASIVHKKCSGRKH